MNACETNWLDAACALPGWGSAVMTGVATLTTAIVVMLGSHAIERRRARKECTRQALIQLLPVVDEVVRGLPQDWWPGLAQASEELVDRYSEVLLRADTDLRVKAARQLAWALRAALWDDSASAAGAIRGEEPGMDEIDPKAIQTRDFLWAARDAIVNWLREERTRSLNVKMPGWLEISGPPWEVPGPRLRKRLRRSK